MQKIYNGKKYAAGWENGLIVGHRTLVQMVKCYFKHDYLDESAEFRKGYEKALADVIQHAKLFNDEIHSECTCGACEEQL